MTRSCLAKVLAVCTVALGVSMPALAQVVTYPMYVNDFATTDYGIQSTLDVHPIVRGPIASIDNHREPILHPLFMDRARREMLNSGILTQSAVLGGGCNSCGTQVLSQPAVYEGGITNGVNLLAPAAIIPPGEVYPNPLGTDKYPLIDLGIGVNNNL